MRFSIRKIRNNKLRFFPLLLSICILCTLLTAPSAVSSASSQEELTDIKAHWAESVILKWVNQGLAKGYGDGRFGPNDSITRAEFVTLLNRIFGYQHKSEKSFPDVKAGAWYAAEIAKAYEAGIIGGDNNGNMNPEAVISRQEAAVILARAFSLAGDNLDAALKYSDVGQIAEWALGSVGTMTKKGYVTGRPGNLFAPKANLSRCEAVKMIDNVMGELINTSGTYTRVVPGNMVISSPG
ncbi:MAG: S-layer homology domain-containing protein, partial [Clostridiaceae bacterium]|nr:S-layer homology domain-containing protein [Clostridiaceae bacterium]